MLQFALFVPALRAQTFSPTPSLTIPSSDISPRSEATGAPVNDFSVTVRTDVLNHFVERQSVESNNVATQVMEADVRGVQTTTTSNQLQSVNSSGSARLHILTTGTVSSTTVGLTTQARVATLGNHTFSVTKPVFFDGNRFLTKPAYGSLRARQFPQAVNSIASGMPLLGPIGDRIARREVYRRMPSSDAIVVRQVADDVLPKVNAEVDRQLAELNGKWRDLRQTIRRVSGGRQTSWAASTTDNSFSLSASSPSTTQHTPPSGQTLTTDLQDEEVVAVTFSQDSINRWLNAQPLGGLTIPDTALQQALQTFQNAKKNPRAFLQLLQRQTESSVEPLIFSLQLAKSSPVLLALEGGLLTLRIRFQVVPKLAPASQMHQMRIVLGGQSATDGKWTISLRQISVDPADRNAVPDAWTTLIGGQATQMVGRVPPSELPRTLDLSHIDKRIPATRIHRIQCEAGQLRISFNLDATSQEITTGRLVR
ncbi:MAG: hypothetical protein GY758_16410 [Fuerstiella sp.]|nr:hypothetical protein [Fuerstiella sp.]